MAAPPSSAPPPWALFLKQLFPDLTEKFRGDPEIGGNILLRHMLLHSRIPRPETQITLLRRTVAFRETGLHPHQRMLKNMSEVPLEFNMPLHQHVLGSLRQQDDL